MIMVNQERLSAIQNITLRSGRHGRYDALPEGVSVLEAVAYVAEEEWRYHPRCACPVIGAFVGCWDDDIRSDAVRTRLFDPLIPRLIGTRSTLEVELRRSYMALDWLVRVQMPAWLELAGLHDHAAQVRELAEIHDETSCERTLDVIHAAEQAACAAQEQATDAAGEEVRPVARGEIRDAAWRGFERMRRAAEFAAGGAAKAAALHAALAAVGEVAEDVGDAHGAGDARGIERAAVRTPVGTRARNAAWNATWDAVLAAAFVAAWETVQDVVTADWDAALTAARRELAPTVERLQASALDLIARMIAAETSPGQRGYTVRRGVSTRPEEAVDPHALRETRVTSDDGAVILHAGATPPTCPDCGVGHLIPSGVGYVPWNRACDRCGSLWMLRQVTYYLEPVRAEEPRDVPPSLRPIIEVRYRTIGPALREPDWCDSLPDARSEPVEPEEGAPTHGALLRLITDELVSAAIADGERRGAVPYVPAYWGHRARFYR